jgi:saccharopine dehydrogenase-like NADP-dependent oxidoreductase
VSKKFTIGIVGGYGDIGSIVSKELIKDSCYDLRIGGRNRSKIDEHVMKLGEIAHGKQVDVYNEREVEQFCRDCSIIINCTGPSWLVKDRVIKYALKAGCDYVDPGIWYDNNNLYKQPFEERGLTGLLYAGWVPGITGLLPRHLYNNAKKSLDSIHSLDVYCGDRSSWSASASHDILYHFIRGVQPGIFANGQWSGKSALYPFWGSRYHKHPGNIGSLLVNPGYTAELEDLAQEAKLPRMGSYIGCAGILGNLKLFIIRHAKISDEKAVAVLMKTIKKETDLRGPGGAVSCVLTGKKNGKNVRLSLSMFDTDTIRLTGICTAMATRMIIEKKIKKKGLIFLCDAIEPSVYFKRLAENGIRTYDQS